MRFHSFKSNVAEALGKLGVNHMLGQVLRSIDSSHIRIVNYHGTDKVHQQNFEQQLMYFSKHYHPAILDDLSALLGGNYKQSKPGLIISFDDGFASNAEVAAPLLEKYGFAGWFFVPVDFIDMKVDLQKSFIEEKLLGVGTAELSQIGTSDLSMSGLQLRSLTNKHLVGCHTQSHTRLKSSLSDDELQVEIVCSKHNLENIIDQEVSAFSWVGGQDSDYSSSAAKVIGEAGYKYSLMTNSLPVYRKSNALQLQRTHIECDWSIEMVKLQLSGLVDAMYYSKRKRINQRTNLNS